MITLTSKGSFAEEFKKHFPTEIVSIRELEGSIFWQKIKTAKIIVHNASSINCIGMDDCMLKNFDFTKGLIDFLAKENPTVDLTYISSMSILDAKSDQKYADPKKMTPYAFSKYKAEDYCLKSPLSCLKSVRFSTLFYKDPEKDGLSRLIYDAVTKKEITIYDGGVAKRDFIPLSIAVCYVERVAALNPCEKRIFNITSGKETSFREVVDYLRDLIPDLKVKDVQSKIDFSPVLSDFHTDSIDYLGQIKFDLRDEIKNYINEICKQ
jgi:nucleoside-diphosphate-sugar epimerase